MNSRKEHYNLYYIFNEEKVRAKMSADDWLKISNNLNHKLNQNKLQGTISQDEKDIITTSN